MRKRVLALLYAVLLNTLVGLMLAFYLELPVLAGVLAVNALGFVVPFLKLPSGLRVGVLVEAWTGQVIEHYTHMQEGTFLDGVPDFSQYSENDVIHMVDVGFDPDVLINNTTYPLEIQDLEDGDVTISLVKFETKPTRITDDELYAASYEKMKIVKERHGNQIGEKIIDKALHAFAPASHDAAATPILVTTGADDGTGRKMLKREDIVKLKAACDKIGMPKAGRRLVLCADHINDLLMLDQKFKDQYTNYETGAIGKMYGFEIYEQTVCPIYTVATRVKKSFGAVQAAGDYEASVVFYVKRMFKAKGTTKAYASEAKTDPVNKQNLMSFTSRFVALPQKTAGSIAAIVSGTV